LTEHARRKAGELAGDLKRQAEESAEDMRQRARSAVDQQKDAAVGGIEGVGLESLANWVSRRNIDDATGGLEDFARQRPVACIGGAVVAGFALARFMKSSSARRSPTGAELLFEVFSQRYERGSVIVTSNLPFDEWTSVFGSERLTGALLDRLTHHVNILEMNGGSYRLRQSKHHRRSPSSNASQSQPA
jgi:hypothetical protein